MRRDALGGVGRAAAHVVHVARVGTLLFGGWASPPSLPSQGSRVARVVTQARDHPGTHARVRGFRRRFSGQGGERASHVVGIGKQAQGDLGDAAEHGARHGRPVDGRRGHVRAR